MFTCWFERSTCQRLSHAVVAFTRAAWALLLNTRWEQFRISQWDSDWDGSAHALANSANEGLSAAFKSFSTTYHLIGSRKLHSISLKWMKLTLRKVTMHKSQCHWRQQIDLAMIHLFEHCSNCWEAFNSHFQIPFKAVNLVPRIFRPKDLLLESVPNIHSHLTKCILYLTILTVQ